MSMVIIGYNHSMTATAHALVAGAIASKFGDPATAGTLAFVSHFVMDSIPHWDIGTNWRNRTKRVTGTLAIADTLIATTVAYFLFKGNVALPTLAVAVVAALIPDWLETPWYIVFARQKKLEPSKHAGFWEKLTYRIYKLENIFHAKTQFPLGALTQAATVLFFLILLR